MKLKDELSEAIQRFSSIDKQASRETIQAVYESGKYKVFEERIHWLFFNSFYTAAEISQLYRKYNCNDTHVYTLAKNAFNSLNIDINEVIEPIK